MLYLCRISIISILLLLLLHRQMCPFQLLHNLFRAQPSLRVLLKTRLPPFLRQHTLRQLFVSFYVVKLTSGQKRVQSTSNRIYGPSVPRPINTKISRHVVCYKIISIRYRIYNQNLCNSSGIRKHTHSPLNLSLVRAWNTCRRLIIYTKFESGWHPIHKLNGFLKPIDNSFKNLIVPWFLCGQQSHLHLLVPHLLDRASNTPYIFLNTPLYFPSRFINSLQNAHLIHHI